VFFNVGLLLLAAWLLGIVGVYALERVHVLLVGSLMFFLFAFLERRRPDRDPTGHEPS
jgi:hypothetical protein